MKRIVLSFITILTCVQIFAQVNYSGAYGYSRKPSGDTGNDDKATGPAGNLVLIKMEGNKYRFWLDVTIGWPSYHTGETDGTINIVNDTASFDNTFEGAPTPCVLKFKVMDNTIHIFGRSDAYNCGFENNVKAEGDYIKLKNQPVFNNDWLKKEYKESPGIVIKDNKAELFQDETLLHPFSPKQFFEKGDVLLNIAETEKGVYTEFFSASGRFIWGWLKKSAVKTGPGE